MNQQITMGDLLKGAIDLEGTTFISANRSLMECSMSTKKRPAFVKVAVTDDLAKGMLHQKDAVIILHIDGNEFRELEKRLLEERRDTHEK